MEHFPDDPLSNGVLYANKRPRDRQKNIPWTSVRGVFAHAHVEKKSIFLVHVAGVLKNAFGGLFGSLRRWRTSPGAFLTIGTCVGAVRIFL